LNQPKRTALLVGSTGLVGHECLLQLLDDALYSSVTAITRESLNIPNPKLNNIVLKFDELYLYQSAFAVNDVFCCLGTTMKKAGSKTKFMKVDYEYVMNVAKLSEENGAETFNVVSAVGADIKSGVFYNHVKGKVEQDLAQNKIHAINIFRPSLLLGKRSEFRLGERIGIFLGRLTMPFYIGPAKKYKPVKAAMVAKAMIAAARQKKEGIHVYEYPQMLNLVNSLEK
jgi:nucleoside-diphosphate-sugar epimerase